ncbi:MAG: YceI family protein [Acidimicrobiales bacterium]|jgi:polyisoprenoid-binding protein YceI|nr:YceI family protein [Acidimicrobiales bacterium]
MSVTETPGTRTFEGEPIPAPGSFAIDPSHTTVGFVARHLMVTKVRGRFTAFEGSIVVAEEPLASSVAVSIDAASIDTREADRDAHLRSADFLDVESFPTLAFRSTGVTHVKGDDWVVAGELTVRGVTRPVQLELEIDGIVRDPWGNERLAFSAETEIDREEFGLTWNVALETGGVLVGRKVKIEIEGQGVRQA